MSGETFGPMLKRLRIRAVLSQNQLARQAGCDPAYVNRLEGSKVPPRRDGQASVPGRAMLLAFAEVLDASQAEAGRLLFAAGLAPQADWQTRAEAAEAKLGMIQQIFDVPTDLLLFRKRVG